jgi:hypothetical protein
MNLTVFVKRDISKMIWKESVKNVVTNALNVQMSLIIVLNAPKIVKFLLIVPALLDIITMKN